MRGGHVIPIEVDIEQDYEQVPMFKRRLRPEFLVEELKPDLKLSNGAFINPYVSAESDADDLNLAKAGRQLQQETIPRLVERLHRLELTPVDSFQISQCFHGQGVNIRFLGHVAQQTRLPHIKEICEVEMIARSCKKLIRQELRELILQMQENYSKEVENQQEPGSGGQQSSSYPQQKSTNETLKATQHLSWQNKFIEKSREILAKFYARFFGVEQDSRDFWGKTLIRTVREEYDYQLSTQFPPPQTPGALFHALNYHLRVKVSFDSGIYFFTKNNYFVESKFSELMPYSKTFQYRSLPLRKFANKYRLEKQRFREQKFTGSQEAMMTLGKIQDLLKISLFIHDNVSNKEFSMPAGSMNPVVLHEMAELQFQMAEYQEKENLQQQTVTEAIQRIKQSIGFNPILHAQNIRSLCLLIKIYIQLGEINQCLNEYDTALKNLE